MAAKYRLIHEDANSQIISQMQNGSLALSTDGNAAIFMAGAAGSVVGKSALSTRITPVTTTDPKMVNVGFDFMIPDGSPLDSIMIADFESSCREIGSNPGIRVYLRDGYLRVDRSKLGEDEAWYAEQSVPIQGGEWNEIEINMLPGVDGAGLFEIYLNGELVLSETGNNVLSEDVLAEIGLPDANVHLDRIQVGLTANSTEKDAAIAIRDLVIVVDDEVIVDGFLSAVVVADAIYETGTENEPVIVKIDPGTAYFGLTLSGTQGADVLFGEEWDDIIAGGAGDDLLFGGLGTDTLTGEGGADVFVFRAGMGHDIIKDFTVGTDTIGFDSYESFDGSKFDAFDTCQGVVLHYQGDSYTLFGVSRADLSVDDFLII